MTAARRLSRWFRRLACRLFGHRWIRQQYLARCGRCAAVSMTAELIDRMAGRNLTRGQKVALGIRQATNGDAVKIQRAEAKKARKQERNLISFS